MPDTMGREHPQNYPWNNELDAQLRDLWDKKPTVELALIFHCTHHTINRRAIRLGLPKRPELNKHWPIEKEELLAEMWADGAPCTEIGMALGVSRNAVIGKRMRMKLPGRGKRGNTKVRTTAQRRRPSYTIKTARGAPLPPRVPTRTPMMVDMETFDAANPGIGLMELGSLTCRSVLRTVPAGARYCGEEVVAPGKSFCPGHHAIYYTPAQPRMRRA